MIVEFDTQPRWINTVADLFAQNQGDGTGYRTYAAIQLPKLLVLVMQEETTFAVPSPYDLHSRPKQPHNKYDCVLGWHDADAPAGYTHPEAVGYRHSKLTIMRPVANDTKTDMLLSEVIEKAPVLDPSAERNLMNLDQMSISLPPEMIELIRKRAAVHFGHLGHMSVKTLIWTAIHEYLDNIQ